MEVTEEYLELYDMYRQLAEQAAGENAQRVINYHPDEFIAMAKEIIRLRKEHRNAAVAAARYYLEVERSNRLEHELEQTQKLLREVRAEADKLMRTGYRAIRK